MTLHVTLLYSGLLGLWLIILSARVIVSRRDNKVSLGHGESQPLERRIRAQGNFSEYTPMGLVLLGVLEISGTSDWILHVLGLLLLSGRLMHGWALSFKDHSALRVPGMAITLTMIGIASLIAIVSAIF